MHRTPRRTYDEQWARLAARHRRSFPTCAVAGCGRRGFYVDHIENVKDAPHRRLDPTNLQTLCKRHHNSVTAGFDSGSIAGACDAAGRTLDPNHPWAQESNEAAIAAVNEARKPPKGLAGALKRDAVRQRGAIRHVERQSQND